MSRFPAWRSLRAALLALLVLLSPSVAHATTLAPSGSTIVRGSDTDGILSPGESFGFIARMSDTGGSDFGGGRGQLSTTEPQVESMDPAEDFTEQNGEVANDPAYPAVDPAFPNPKAFNVKLTTNYQCGKSLPLRLSVTGLYATSSLMNFSVPTGAPGALRSYASDQSGGVLTEGSSFDSAATVPAGAAPDTVTDYVRGVRVHIDELQYRYTWHWLRLELVAPDGTTVTLYDDQDATVFPNKDATLENKDLHDITFVSKGDPAGTKITSTADVHDGAVLQANDDLSALLSGHQRSGAWKLRVKDIPPPADARSGRPHTGSLGRSGSTATTTIGTLGGWQLGVNAAVCSATPGAKAGPDAWFGGADPVVVSPGGGSLSAAASTPAKSDDPAYVAPTVSSYAWDTHTGSGGPAAYTDATGQTLTIPSQTRGTKIVKLQVTDSNGATSAVSRTIVISELPTVDAIVANPVQPQAGDPVALQTTVSDSAGTDKIKKVEWDLNDDGTFETATDPATFVGVDADTVTASTNTTFATSGLHVVRVRVTNDLGATAVSTKVITTANQPPTASFVFKNLPTTGTPVVAVGDTVALDGTASADADGQVGKWEWNVDSGATDQFVDGGTTPTFNTTYSVPGIYTVQLRVTDNMGDTGSVTRDIRVTAKPTPVIDVSNPSPTVNTAVGFSGTGSTDDGSIASYQWDVAGAKSSGPTLTKSFPNAGNVVVKLTVTDNDGVTATTSSTIKVVAASTGGSTGGGTTPTPTPAPSPTPKPGSSAPPVTVPGGGTIPSPVFVGADAATTFWSDPNQPAHSQVQVGDYAAALSVASKQKAKKAYKNGIAAKLTATGAGKFALKAMITTKVAKSVGIKTKAKLLSVGSGTLTIKKGGTFKFVVKFNKKYAKNLKKSKSLAVSLRGVVKTSDGTQVPVGKNIKIVK